MEKLRLVGSVIRRGRVSRIEKGRLTFLSGEQLDLPANTLAVDCARNGSLFATDFILEQDQFGGRDYQLD